MREFPFKFDEGLQKGLRPNLYVPRDSQWLIQALGVIPEDDLLQTIPQLPTAINATGETYPYPQIFKLLNFILVCGKLAIYEYDLDSTNLTLRFVASSAGATWSYADFNDYFVLTNGNVLITRDPITGIYSEPYDCGIPHCLCLCDLNGQIIVGGPGVSVAEGFTGE
jgi:hypothetical protein